jgi:hypothetical protein
VGGLVGELRGCLQRRVTYPDVEVEVLVRYGLDIEAYCWYCGHDLADLNC